MANDDNLNEFQCALSTTKHIIQNPILVSCGHYVCKKCLPNCNNSKLSILCKLCEKKIEVDLTENYQSFSFKKKFQSSLNHLFYYMEREFSKALNDFKG